MSLRTDAIIYAIFFFLGSLLIFPFFTGGDQISYRLFYFHASFMDIPTALISYKENLSSAEPVYFYLVYIFSRFLEKDIFFSIINGVLGYCLFHWLLSQKVNRYVLYLLCLNFYVVVLLFSAERLKLAILFFLLGILGRGFVRYIFYSLSVFSHAQIFIMLIIVQVKKMCSIFRNFRNKKIYRDIFVLIAFFAFLFFGAFLMRNHIAAKMENYSRSGGFSSLLKPLLFLVLSAFVAKKEKLEAVLSHFPILVISFFVGSERLVIFSYFIFMYYGLKNKNGLNLPVLASSIYFFIGGIFFIYKIINFGDGFYGGASWISMLLKLF